MPHLVGIGNLAAELRVAVLVVGVDEEASKGGAGRQQRQDGPLQPHCLLGPLQIPENKALINSPFHLLTNVKLRMLRN